MRIAVITPYLREPLDQLWRCHESVANQTHTDTVHFMVADGQPRAEVDGWAVRHLPLPWTHGDFGDTPRAVGAMSAASQGFDAVAFLDADNWFDPQHIEAMVGVQAAADADIVTAARKLIRADGSVMGVCQQSDGIAFCDMNCFLFTRRALKAIGLWAFKDPRASAVDDYVLWSLVKQSNARVARSVEPTVNYVTLWANHYLERGEEPPPGARCMLTAPGEPYPKVFDYWTVRGMHERGEPITA